MELRETDYVPLDDFPLAWRWIGPRRDGLAPAPGAVRPLTLSAAAAIAPEAARRCAERRIAELTVAIVAEDDHIAEVQARLSAFGIADTTPVLVSWDARTAVATTWGIFVAHWPGFCYPSSDEVTIWDPHASWTLCYRHFEVFEFSHVPRAA